MRYMLLCTIILLLLLFMYFSVLNVRAFIFTVFISRNDVILAVFLTLPNMREIWLAIKPGSAHHLFLKCPVESQEYGSFYQIVRFYLLGVCFSVSVVQLFSSYSWCVLLRFGLLVRSVLCYIDLWLMNSGIQLLPSFSRVVVSLAYSPFPSFMHWTYTRK